MFKDWIVYMTEEQGRKAMESAKALVKAHASHNIAYLTNGGTDERPKEVYTYDICRSLRLRFTINEDSPLRAGEYVHLYVRFFSQRTCLPLASEVISFLLAAGVKTISEFRLYHDNQACGAIKNAIGKNKEALSCSRSIHEKYDLARFGGFVESAKMLLPAIQRVQGSITTLRNKIERTFPEVNADAMFLANCLVFGLVSGDEQLEYNKSVFPPEA